MANTSTNIYTGQIAHPETLFDSGQLGGRIRAIIATATVTSTDFDADGDTIKICALPGSARITSIKMFNADLGSGESDFDIGIYTHKGALIDEDEFAEGITAFAAAVEFPTEQLGVGITAAALSLSSTLWERAGAAVDTGVLYDIVCTQTATVVTPITGIVGFIVEYTIS